MYNKLHRYKLKSTDGNTNLILQRHFNGRKKYILKIAIIEIYVFQKAIKH